MADLTPNDLSHLSDEAFWALCPQGEHAPGPEPLSPAADAVLDAYMNNCGWLDGPLERDYRCAAAVLRAAADQIEPDDGVSTEARQVLNKLLAIADELENHQ